MLCHYSLLLEHTRLVSVFVSVAKRRQLDYNHFPASRTATEPLFLAKYLAKAFDSSPRDARPELRPPSDNDAQSFVAQARERYNPKVRGQYPA